MKHRRDIEKNSFNAKKKKPLYIIPNQVSSTNFHLLLLFSYYLLVDGCCMRRDAASAGTSARFKARVGENAPDNWGS
jgi:hypothetical protein